MALETLHYWLLSLATLIILEVVLGIDNIIFISIISQRLPTQASQKKARRLGLAMACITRIIFLACVSMLTHLVTPIFTVQEFAFSVRDLLFVLGGVYLIYGGTKEIHAKITGLKFGETVPRKIKKVPPLSSIIMQIMVMDIVFSIDSVMTAVGMVNEFSIMALAIFIAIAIMLFATEAISKFLKANPSIEVLALCFLIMVGMVLLADGFHHHIPRGYIYFAIAFSVFVEWINITAGQRTPRKK